MVELERIPWMISLHGGHSSGYCDHAADPLEAMITQAIAQGMPIMGITEHAPRVEEERLYVEEKEMGWTIETLDRLFSEYAAALDELIPRYADKIQLLKGFEIEVVPEGRYVDVMQDFRHRYGFEYVIGSVHYVAGHIIDYRQEDFESAVQACGGVEKMIVRYYQAVGEMVEAIKPEVVGHLDLVARSVRDEALLSTPAVKEAAFSCLDVIAAHGAILDVNTAGYRKGLGRPYPAAWIVRAALEREIPCCFGDDSHAIAHVGAGIAEARNYLLECGLEHITALKRGGQGLEHLRIPLSV